MFVIHLSPLKEYNIMLNKIYLFKIVTFRNIPDYRWTNSTWKGFTVASFKILLCFTSYWHQLVLPLLSWKVLSCCCHLLTESLMLLQLTTISVFFRNHHWSTSVTAIDKWPLFSRTVICVACTLHQLHPAGPLRVHKLLIDFSPSMPDYQRGLTALSF